MIEGTCRINGRKFRLVPEEEYRELQAVKRERQRQSREDAADVAIALRRIRTRRKLIPHAQLKRELGL
jgi:hypothetical protein